MHLKKCGTFLHGFDFFLKREAQFSISFFHETPGSVHMTCLFSFFYVSVELKLFVKSVYIRVYVNLVAFILLFYN